MSEVKADAGRRGGREARRAQRAAPLALNQRPVWPGLEGGRFKPLSDEDVLRIHHAALDVLEQIGLADAIPSCIEVCTAAGAVMNDKGRLLFPRAVVEDTLAKAARRFPLHGQDPQHDLEPWGKRVYFGTAGAAVNIVDPISGAYRESTVKDAYDIARIVDQMEHIHFYQRSVVCRDIPDPADMDFNTCYASVMGTTKHVGTSWVAPEQCEASLEMLHMISGGEDKWRARPFVSQSNCFVVPPLKFATDACRCLEVAVRGGMPVLLLSAGQAGATAPASLAGAIVQEVAEVLAGLVYVNAIKPGAVAIFGTWPFVSDLRTGAMSGGSPEQALLSAACGQMAHFYDLTGGTASGMSDSKIPDAQAGMEKGINHALVGNAGANLDLRIRRHACEPAGLLPGEPGPRQRHHRRRPAHHPRHPSGRGIHRGGDHPGCLPQRAGTLSRLRPDAEAHADGICLSRGGRPAQPERLDGTRRHQCRRPRHAEDQGDPAEALSAACLAGGG